MTHKEFIKLPKSAKDNMMIVHLLKQVSPKKRKLIGPDMISALKTYLHGLSDIEIRDLEVDLGYNRKSNEVMLLCKLNKDSNEEIVIRNSGIIYPLKYSPKGFVQHLAFGQTYATQHECLIKYSQNINASLYPS